MVKVAGWFQMMEVKKSWGFLVWVWWVKSEGVIEKGMEGKRGNREREEED